MFCFICSNFLLRLDSLASKSGLGIKFACAILALKTSDPNSLNSEVSICLSSLWSKSFFSISVTSVIVCFFN